jgi:hypothetical protein
MIISEPSDNRVRATVPGLASHERPRYRARRATWPLASRFNAGGNQEHQRPRPVGTTVRSMCQTWSQYLAVTTRPLLVALVAGRGFGAASSLRIRPTVVVPRCSPARAKVWAIFIFPIEGHRVFSRWTMYRTKSGKRFTGVCVCTKASGPSSSKRPSQDATVGAVTWNTRAVCSNDQPRTAFGSRIAKRSVGGSCGRR